MAPRPAIPHSTTEVLAVSQASAQLSELIDRAHAGETILLAGQGNALVRLVPIPDRRHLRVPGKGKGRFEVKAGFHDPLPDDLFADPK